ncbi:hypothetical protein SAMN05421786_11097 [Chryseobacterium ureilyticum]|uniref:Uncharacterized protein n=1 Tax=Chryseobacterium ureilyticum TaxID=373668 RepID=A0A1N7QII3_9FLAO|nr:hypothetical protein [Chryseobacterium ureilyticum]SIT22599.1 hypothetical protein SAMN05421786_11097 [Chryseobacterium ureilyticum]
MKKILPLILLAFVGLFVMSCDNNDNVVGDGDTISLMQDATGTFSSGNNFRLTQGINIESTDVVLVYRREGNLWQQIPKTYYLDNVNGYPTGRELDYNFQFDTRNVNVETKANFNQSTEMTSSETNQYLTNQTFRIVLVPANGSGSRARKADVDYSDYNAVVKYYNLDDSHVPVTRVN